MQRKETLEVKPADGCREQWVEVRTGSALPGEQVSGAHDWLMPHRFHLTTGLQLLTDTIPNVSRLFTMKFN